jgi:hypothetical protein
MNTINTLYSLMDPALAWVFRAPSNPWAGFILGLCWLALLASVLGELSMAVAFRINKAHFTGVNQDMVENHNLSLRALAAKDKNSWKACNQLANDAFGKNFFSGATLFAASLWPAALGLGWLDWRFGAVSFDLPLVGSVGPSFLFIPIYVLTRIALAVFRPKIPLLRRLKFSAAKDTEQLLTFSEVFGPVPEKKREV